MTETGARPSKNRWIPYLYLSPFFIIFLVFGLYPILFSAWISLHSWELNSSLMDMEWQGVANFEYILTDEWFYRALYTTLWLAIVSGLPQHLLAIPLSTLLFRMSATRRHLLLCFYFLPFITSSVAISLVFTSLFSRDFGVLNQLLNGLHDWTVWGRVRA